jgi:hypothetical protein
MAWENVIIGYEIVRACVGAQIPKSWEFLCKSEGRTYGDDYFIFKKPIYKKKNIKSK